MKYCTKCGTQLDDNTKFCPSCGNPVDTGNAGNNLNASYQQGNPTPMYTPSSNTGYAKENNTKNIIIIVLSAVVVLFAIVMLVMSLGNRSDSGNAATETATTQETTTEVTTEVTTTEETTTEASTEEATTKAKKKKKNTSSNSNEEKMPTGKGTCPTRYDTYYALVDTGYLALRSARNNNDSNIIGKMNTGDPVYVVKTDGLYWYVYSPNLGMYGYTNSGYLSTYDSTVSVNYHEYMVDVKEGTYLALRCSPETSDDNIIGKIYRNDIVEVYSYEGKFAYVYSPTLGMWGYVNSDYLK